jgi:hypothetical protein
VYRQAGVKGKRWGFVFFLENLPRRLYRHKGIMPRAVPLIALRLSIGTAPSRTSPVTPDHDFVGVREIP